LVETKHQLIQIMRRIWLNSKLTPQFSLLPYQGPLKYYVSKEVGGWGQKVAIFADLQYYLGRLELVSKELNHFGVIACLFRQIGGHSSRFVLFCSF
jgi:hypothetical protein